METGGVEFTGDFYSMAHFSKFIHQGAVVLDSTDIGADSNYKLVNLVTRNPNGTMTAVIVNYSAQAEVMKLVLDEQVIEVEAAPRSIITLTWVEN
jgi:O-glycosyl hydrolase